MTEHAREKAELERERWADEARYEAAIAAKAAREAVERQDAVPSEGYADELDDEGLRSEQRDEDMNREWPERGPS